VSNGNEGEAFRRSMEAAARHEAAIAAERAKAAAAFDRAQKQVRKLIRAAAAGEDNWRAIDKAINALYKRADKPELRGQQAYYYRVKQLAEEGQGALEAGRMARALARAAESARLREEMREAQPRGYEKELALSAARRGW
jgi:ribosome-associated translation inhibitor RaiA